MTERIIPAYIGEKRECKRCGHGWTQKRKCEDGKPRQCPNCKSPLWDKERDDLSPLPDEAKKPQPSEKPQVPLAATG